MTRLRAAAATDAGRVRTSNQDSALVAGDLIVVADGMGGHAGGEVAARTAVDALEHAYRDDSNPEALQSAAASANRAVFERAERDQALRGMGTTLTAAALLQHPEADSPQEIALVNVGDSRAYLFEDGSLRRLTEDHSLVEEMVRRGELSPEAALTHPHRHILTRALGIDPGVEIDLWTIPLQPGARLLLCSDGLTNECTEEEIATVLAEVADLQLAAQQLVTRALEHGGNDNVTVVVAELDDSVDDEAEAAEPAPVEVEIDAAHASAPEVDGTLASAIVPSSRLPRTRRPLGASVTAREQRGPRPRADRLGGLVPGHHNQRAVRPSEPTVTPRVALFVIAFLVIVGGILGFVIWFNRATYFVGIAQGNVAIYQGRPGGFLWFKPTLIDRSTLAVSSVFPANLPVLKTGVLESSYDDARTVVTNLTNERSLVQFSPAVTSTTSTNTTTISTTTTVAPVTTTSSNKGPGH